MLRKLAVLMALACWIQTTQAQEATSPVQDNEVSEVRVLRTNNKAQVTRYICETLEMKNVNPFNLINFFWAEVSREEGGIFVFKHPEEPGGLITVICPEYQLESLRQLALDLDRSDIHSGPGSYYGYYRMRHRSATDAGLRAAVGLWMGQQPALLPDVETNSLLIYDSPVGGETAKEFLIREIDKPLTQVEFGVKVYEVAAHSDGALGLDFEAWKNGPGKVAFQFINAAKRVSMKNNAAGQSNINTRGGYLAYPSAFFDFLVAEGKAKVMVDTKMIGINAMPAHLTSGDRVLYYNTAAPATLNIPSGAVAFDRTVTGQTATMSSLATAYAFPTSGPAPAPPVIGTADAGLVLTVVPTVGLKTINLDIDLSVNNILGYDSSGAPVMGSRQIVDAVAVEDGAEIMLGGLVRERKIQTSAKVPILGQIPLIGYAFGGEKTLTQKSLLVTAITASVVGQENMTEADQAIAGRAKGESVVQLP